VIRPRSGARPNERRPPACLCVCPSARLRVCPSLCPSVSLSVCTSVCPYSAPHVAGERPCPNRRLNAGAEPLGLPWASPRPPLDLSSASPRPLIGLPSARRPAARALSAAAPGRLAGALSNRRTSVCRVLPPPCSTAPVRSVPGSRHSCRCPAAQHPFAILLVCLPDHPASGKGPPPRRGDNALTTPSLSNQKRQNGGAHAAEGPEGVFRRRRFGAPRGERARLQSPTHGPCRICSAARWLRRFLGGAACCGPAHARGR
jgi:hypothetical protein